jgi:hypothetical protein
VKEHYKGKSKEHNQENATGTAIKIREQMNNILPKKKDAHHFPLKMNQLSQLCSMK